MSQDRRVIVPLGSGGHPEREDRMKDSRVWVICLAVWLSLFLLGRAGTADPEADPDVVQAERTLHEAGVATDGPGLLAYLRARTLSPEEQDRLGSLVRRLGDGDFEVREQASRDLVRAGRAALPHLRLAVNDADLEVRRRVRRCLDEIQQGPVVLIMSAVARLLTERRPPGTVAALLAYLPSADDEVIEEAYFNAINAVGFSGDKPDPVLLDGVRDPHPLRRAAAARALGSAVHAEQHRPVLPLLQDADPRVRFEAATALVRSGEKAAVPALLTALTDGPVSLAWQAEELLYRVAGEKAPDSTLGSGDPPTRRRCREVWTTWWRAHGAERELTRLGPEETLRGLTLLCEYDGRVWEAAKDGKARWEITDLKGPNDAQLLAGGRVLVAERNGNKVTERDRQGRILWEHNANNPIACQRLPNGNTLVATFTELYEVTTDQRRVFRNSENGGYRHAIRMRNGHTVFVTSNGQVVELDTSWRQVRSITPSAYAAGAGYWASVEPLSGGHFLLALGGAGRVIEIDGTGKILWECSVPEAVFATRLRNGNTLVASFNGRFLVEMDKTGKEVAKQTLQGRPFTVRRY
jgi:hypothetical protein